MYKIKVSWWYLLLKTRFMHKLFFYFFLKNHRRISKTTKKQLRNNQKTTPKQPKNNSETTKKHPFWKYEINRSGTVNGLNSSFVGHLWHLSTRRLFYRFQPAVKGRQTIVRTQQVHSLCIIHREILYNVMVGRTVTHSLSSDSSRERVL